MSTLVILVDILLCSSWPPVAVMAIALFLIFRNVVKIQLPNASDMFVSRTWLKCSVFILIVAPAELQSGRVHSDTSIFNDTSDNSTHREISFQCKVETFSLLTVMVVSFISPKVCQMLFWQTKNSLYSINIKDTVTNGVPLCPVHQAPSYGPILTLLAWFLRYLDHSSMPFILEVLCTAQISEFCGKWC